MELLRSSAECAPCWTNVKNLPSPGNTSASRASPGTLTQTQQSVHRTSCLSVREEHKNVEITSEVRLNVPD